MLGGIAFQIVVITFFTASSAEFLWRYSSNRPISRTTSTKIRGRASLPIKLQLALLLVAGSTTLLFIRAIYRTIELSDGWGGKIMTTEIWFSELPLTVYVDGASLIRSKTSSTPRWLLWLCIWRTCCIRGGSWRSRWMRECINFKTYRCVSMDCRI